MTSPITITTNYNPSFHKGEIITFFSGGSKKVMEVVSIDSQTIITVKDIRWYKRFWYWVKSLFVKPMTKEQIQDFLYEQTDRFFGQHLN